MDIIIINFLYYEYILKVNHRETKAMLKAKYLSLIFFVAGLFLNPFDIQAQQKATATDTTLSSKKDSSTNDILLYPDALPPRNDGSFLGDPDQSLSTQITYIDGGLGLELIYTMAESRSFLSFMFGMMEPNSTLNFRTKMLTSLTYGYKATIRSQDNNDIEPALKFLGQPDLYIRIGPGISTLGTDYYELGEWQTERLIGFHAFGLIGSSVDIARRSKVNIEIGWRGLWFPASEDLNLMSGPHVSFGFSFSRGYPLNPVSW